MSRGGDTPEMIQCCLACNRRSCTGELCARLITARRKADGMDIVDRQTGRGTLYEHDGARHTLAEWSRLSGVPFGTLYKRVVERGRPIAEALRAEKRGTRLYRAFGEAKTITEWAHWAGVNRETLTWRLHRRAGDDMEAALRYYMDQAGGDATCPKSCRRG